MARGARGRRTIRRPALAEWLPTVLVLGSLAALIALERLRPLRRRVEPRNTRDLRNLTLAVTTGIALRVAEKPVVEKLADFVARRRWGLLQRRTLPVAVETALALALMDYTLYLWHVLLHRVPLLWRCHLVHHVDLDLSASTAIRFHFSEMVLSVPWRAAQVVLIGVRPPILKAWQTATLIEVLFQHSDLGLPLRVERALQWLVVTPRLHGIHHSSVREETDFELVERADDMGLAARDATSRRTTAGDRDRHGGIPRSARTRLAGAARDAIRRTAPGLAAARPARGCAAPPGCVTPIERLNTAARLARGVAQPGRAPALGAGCRRFESSRPDHRVRVLLARWFLARRRGFENPEVVGPMALARIYRPAKSAMQSGRAKTHKWILEYEPASRRDPDPLMGWSSARDTLNELQLRFDTLEEALAYAKKYNLEFTVIEPQARTPKAKSYADNFRYDRVRL